MTENISCWKHHYLLLTLAIGVTLISFALRAQPTTPTLSANEVRIKLLINDKQTLDSNMACIIIPEETVKINAIIEIPEGQEMAIIPTSQGKASQHLKVSSQTDYDWGISGGIMLHSSEKAIIWQAPTDPGNYQVELNFKETRTITHSVVSLKEPEVKEKQLTGKAIVNLLVQYPYNREGKGVINGYPIGIYPNEEGPAVGSHVARNRDKYRPPTHFVKVTPDNETLFISEHFQLADFSPAEEKGKVRFIALKYPLVERLEQIITELNQRGIKAKDLTILRAFLSPNELDRLRRKGLNLSQFTRYQYGDAALIIVDNDGDNKMDDLNNDGKIDVNDAQVLADVVDEIERKTGLYGGLGIYWKYEDPLLPDTPYIHIDMRGTRSRWHYVSLPSEES